MFNWFKKKPQEPDASTIVPRIKNRAFIDAVRSAMPDAPVEQRPVVLMFVADLIVTYGFDLGSSFAMVTHSDADRLGLDAEALHRRALENLHRQVPQVRWEPTGPLLQAVVGGDLEATLLLMAGAWTPLAGRFKGELVAGVPARDLLLVTGSEDELGIRIAFETVREFHGRAGNHSLTKQLLVRTSSDWGWDVLPHHKIPNWGPPPLPPPLPPT